MRNFTGFTPLIPHMVLVCIGMGDEIPGRGIGIYPYRVWCTGTWHTAENYEQWQCAALIMH